MQLLAAKVLKSFTLLDAETQRQVVGMLPLYSFEAGCFGLA